MRKLHVYVRSISSIRTVILYLKKNMIIGRYRSYRAMTIVAIRRDTRSLSIDPEKMSRECRDSFNRTDGASFTELRPCLFSD